MTLGVWRCVGFVRILLLIALLLGLFAAAPAGATIRYRISLADTDKHIFHVQMSIPGVAEGSVALPAWNALYQVRDFSYRVRNVRAGMLRIPAPTMGVNDAESLRQVDKQTWLVPEKDKGAAGLSIVVEYEIAWNDPGPFNSQLDAHHAFLNFAETLMYVPDRRAEDVEVTFDHVPAGWKVLAELPTGKEPNSFTAPSYDKLVDAPVEAGKFEEFGFENGGAHFRVVVDAKEWNRSRLEDGLRRISGYELQLMGGPPFKEYTFFFHIGPFSEVGGGGMEHANCTAISAGSVEAVLQIAAHELFHAWNVKRIRPQSLEPVDYTKEQYTRALWFAEGVTSTYGAYTLERSGIWTKEQFYGDLAGQIGELESRPARKWQSVEESSLDTWFDKYPEYSFPERSINYYNKGQIIGVMLDLAIRDATDNHKSLDDVMRRLNVEYAQAGKFYEDSDGIRKVAEEVSGRSLGDFFRSYIGGTADIPYADFLRVAGLDLQPDSRPVAALGFRVSRAPGSGLTVSSVEEGSRAEAAGLRTGDVVVQINGAAPTSLRRFTVDHAPGDTLKLRVRRGEQEVELSFALAASSDTHYTIAEMLNPTERQLRIRNGLLHGATN
jgi:predicted metalloprotease with PDZ domain